MRRTPPHFSAQTVTQITQGFDGTREQQSFTQGDDFGLEALLLGLCQESFGIWRNNHTSDNFNTLFFECSDLGTEVLCTILEPTWVGQGEAHLRKGFGESEFFVAPCVTVTIIGKEATHFFIGLNTFPPIGEIGDHVFQAPKNMVSPIEAFSWISFTSKEPWLPRHHTRNTGNFIQLCHVTDGVRRLGRTRCQQQ